MRWLAFTLLVLIAGSDAGAKGTLEVEVRGLEQQGVLWIAVHDQPAAFPNDFRRAVRRASTRVSTPVIRIRFEAIPYGWYAISAVQDVNQNGRIDTDFFGRPTEPYGVSGRGRGRPTFEAAKFAVDRSLVGEIVELRR